MAQILTNYSVTGATPSTVGGLGAGIKYFPNLPGPSIGVANTTPSSTSAKGQLNVPGSNRLNGVPFSVVASGNASPDTSGYTLAITMTANVGTISSPTYEVIGTSGAIALTTAQIYYPWQMKLELQGDTQSGLVIGTVQSYVNATLVALAKITITGLTGINFASEPPFGLLVAATFGTTGAKNIANLNEFALSA